MNEPLIVRTAEPGGTVRRRFYEPSARPFAAPAPPRERARARLRLSTAPAAWLLGLGAAVLGRLAGS